MKITAAARPFILTFRATGTSYPLTSEEAQRLLDEYPAITATKNKVVLVGHNTADRRQRTILRPATLGGGPAFKVERPTVESTPEILLGAQIVYGNHQLRDVVGYYRNSSGDWMLQVRHFNGEPAPDVLLSTVT